MMARPASPIQPLPSEGVDGELSDGFNTPPLSHEEFEWASDNEDVQPERAVCTEREKAYSSTPTAPRASPRAPAKAPPPAAASANQKRPSIASLQSNPGIPHQLQSAPLSPNPPKQQASPHQSNPLKQVFSFNQPPGSPSSSKPQTIPRSPSYQNHPQASPPVASPVPHEAADPFQRRWRNQAYHNGKRVRGSGQEDGPIRIETHEQEIEAGFAFEPTALPARDNALMVRLTTTGRGRVGSTGSSGACVDDSCIVNVKQYYSREVREELMKERLDRKARLMEVRQNSIDLMNYLDRRRKLV